MHQFLNASMHISQFINFSMHQCIFLSAYIFNASMHISQCINFSMHQCINLTLWRACMNRRQTHTLNEQQTLHVLHKRPNICSSHWYRSECTRLLGVRIRQRAQREPDQQTNGKKKATSSFHACHSSLCNLNACSCSCVWRCACRRLQGEDKTPYSAGTVWEERSVKGRRNHFILQTSNRTACFTLRPQLFGKIT